MFSPTLASSCRGELVLILLCVCRRDVTSQYAMSLGDFEGGQLCIESDNGHEIMVVNTRNRIAHVDGRFVHWVRGHSGDRYSLIFFSTVPDHYTPMTHSVFLHEDDVFVE